MTTARSHTQRFLHWWHRHGIQRIDLALRLPNGAWIHRLDRLPSTALLAWARHANLHHADIYIRPARGYDWPHLFLDDIPAATAGCLARHHQALVVRTSPAGGCHLHLITDRPLDPKARHRLQAALARRHAADPAATAGVQFQRLPGCRNWKRGGCWVDVIAISHPATPRFPADPPFDLDPQHTPTPHPRSPGTDTSPSGRDWAYVCHRLEHRHHPDDIAAALRARVLDRRGADTDRYVARTLANARAHCGII